MGRLAGLKTIMKILTVNSFEATEVFDFENTNLK